MVDQTAPVLGLRISAVDESVDTVDAAAAAVDRVPRLLIETVAVVVILLVLLLILVKMGVASGGGRLAEGAGQLDGSYAYYCHYHHHPNGGS